MANEVTIHVKGQDSASKVLRDVAATADKAKAPVKGFGSILKNALSVAGGFGIVNAFKGAISSLGGALIGTNATLETATTQFEVLLGSVGAAKTRVAELYEFAAKTPFQFPEILAASKLLQTFGGDVLATGKNLTLVGDMAAASGAQFSEVAMWVGRAYDAMQSGRPFGEAGMRLQELGLMSGEVRGKLEAMQKAGAKGTEMWDFFTKSMGKYNGMMEKQSKTFSGLLSTLVDTANQAMGKLGAPLFALLKAGLDPAIAFLGGPVTDAFTAFEDLFRGDHKAWLTDIDVVRVKLKDMTGIDFGPLLGSVGSLFRWSKDMAGKIGPIAQELAGLVAENTITLISGAATVIGDLAAAGGNAAAVAWATISKGLDMLGISSSGAAEGADAARKSVNLLNVAALTLMEVGLAALIIKLGAPLLGAIGGVVTAIGGVAVASSLLGSLFLVNYMVEQNYGSWGKFGEAIGDFASKVNTGNLFPNLLKELQSLGSNLDSLIRKLLTVAGLNVPSQGGASGGWDPLPPIPPTKRQIPESPIGGGGGARGSFGGVFNFNGPINLPNVTDYASFEREMANRGLRAARLSRSPGGF